MRRLLTFFVAPLLVMTFSTQAKAQQRQLPLSATEAKALEDSLVADPNNLPAREKLIEYYFRAMIKSKSPETEEKRERHVLWLIEHHPESQFAGSPETEMLPMGFLGSMEGYQRGKQLWLQQVELHPDNVTILRNAASFFTVVEPESSRQLLEKAYDLNPEDPETAAKLAQSYELERITVGSPEEKAAFSQRAFTIRERGTEKLEGVERFYALGDLANSALEAGDISKAEQYANELLQDAPKFQTDWNYGNALHRGNIILGRIALQRGDIAGAKSRLLAAGETPGSPQLDSFGPNMTLAKELLQKGERDTVLSYLQSCAKFWKMGVDKLQGWIATIKGGGTPDFSANPLY